MMTINIMAASNVYLGAGYERFLIFDLDKVL